MSDLLCEVWDSYDPLKFKAGGKVTNGSCGTRNCPFKDTPGCIVNELGARERYRINRPLPPAYESENMLQGQQHVTEVLKGLEGQLGKSLPGFTPTVSGFHNYIPFKLRIP